MKITLEGLFQAARQAKEDVVYDGAFRDSYNEGIVGLIWQASRNLSRIDIRDILDEKMELPDRLKEKDTGPQAFKLGTIEEVVSLLEGPDGSGLTVKRVLEVLDLAGENLDSIGRRDLWAILTALRGPDSESAGLKHVTTAIIRGLSLPKLVSSSGGLALRTTGEIGDYDKNTHFGRHVALAVDALTRAGMMRKSYAGWEEEIREDVGRHAGKRGNLNRVILNDPYLTPDEKVTLIQFGYDLFDGKVK
jgi:hypothetical protein